MKILDRFMRYIAIDTTSDSTKNDNPSSEGQRILAEVLVKELNDLNIDEVYYDQDHCYVYAILKGDESLPKIGFVSHLDTSEGAKGNNIKPKIISSYDGGDIILNSQNIISVDLYPNLKNYIGKTIITTDGTTLLGADDKAGIAEIMNMLDYFVNSKGNHGDIYVCFTPDEEIGMGTLNLDINIFKPDFAYTVDGRGLGELSYENFNSAKATISINGIRTHLGKGKGTMINAARIATIINSLLPDELPENTEGYEGFFHLKEISGNVNKATMYYVIMDFNKDNFQKRKETILNIVTKLNDKYNNCITIQIEDRFYNMKDIIESNPSLIENTKKAINNLGIEFKKVIIRGGTDGARISFKGIPCPNLGIGGNNFHSIYEYVCLEDMQKASEILISIVKVFSKNK